jgi:hypothetical protein
MIQTEYYKSAINPGDCISNGWNLVSQNYWMFFGMAILAYAIIFVISCIPLVGIIINGILTGPLYVGIYYTLLKKMRGEEINFGMMFFGFERFVPAMLVSLITMIPYILLQIVQLFSNFASLFINNRSFGNHYQSADPIDVWLAGIGLTMFLLFFIFLVLLVAVYISMFFALQLIAERNLGVMEIIKLSLSAAWANLGGIIILFILEFLILLAGVIAFCIGVFFVLPIVYAANAFAYRQVFPHIDQNRHTTPPMPNEYGSSFGQGL